MKNLFKEPKTYEGIIGFCMGNFKYGQERISNLIITTKETYKKQEIAFLAIKRIALTFSEILDTRKKEESSSNWVHIQSYAWPSTCN